jgi:hypothetical protein
MPMPMTDELIEETASAGRTMEEEIDDPYLYRAAMPFCATHYPLGFPLRIATNSAEILAGAEESWGLFEKRFEMEPIRLQVGLRDDGPSECPGPMTFRAHGKLMAGIADAGNFFITDLMRDVSFGWLTRGAVANRLYLRHHLLEAAALSHIANRYSAPVHAACVAREGCGVLLCGDSGTGKSTLAFGCARTGWTYTSDDASFLVHGRCDRQVVGNCHSIRLRPSASELFDEVKGRPLTPRMRGKPSIEIAMRELPEIHKAVETRIDFMVFLRRQDARQELAPFPRQKAHSYLLNHLVQETDLRREQIASIERLLAVPVYELRYRELDWAVDRLERMVREGS